MDDLISQLKVLGVVYREPVQLKNAGSSDFYVDVKKAYGYPDILNALCDQLWEMMDKRTTCIAASGYGGLPPAVVLSRKHNLKLTLARDEPKKHGKGGWLDGYVPTKDDNVSIIDDVLSSGKSLKKIIEALMPTGANILGCYVFVKRGECKLDMPQYLFVAEDLL
jgi:orotate phosphoribosyltransferase